MDLLGKFWNHCVFGNVLPQLCRSWILSANAFHRLFLFLLCLRSWIHASSTTQKHTTGALFRNSDFLHEFTLCVEMCCLNRVTHLSHSSLFSLPFPVPSALSSVFSLPSSFLTLPSSPFPLLSSFFPLPSFLFPRTSLLSSAQEAQWWSLCQQLDECHVFLIVLCLRMTSNDIVVVL